jgi:hypothetical protein
MPAGTGCTVPITFLLSRESIAVSWRVIGGNLFRHTRIAHNSHFRSVATSTITWFKGALAAVQDRTTLEALALALALRAAGPQLRLS